MSNHILETNKNQTLKVYPCLAQAAMKQRLDRLYRVWTLARSIDPMGRGYIRVADIEELIQTEDIKGLSPGTLRRLLKSGMPTFWDVFYKDGERWVGLRGLRRVCVALDLTSLPENVVLIPVRWAKTVKGFRAACYGSGFPTSVMSNPISRATIENKTGRTPRTQRAYDRALAGQLKKRDNARIVDRKPKHGTELSLGLYVDKVRTPEGDEEIVLLQRLPNSYRVEFKRGPRGMTGRVNGELKEPFDHVAKGKREKLFYRDPQAATKRIHQRRENDWFCVAGVTIGGRPVNQTIGRTALWTEVQRANDKTYYS